MRPQSLVRPFRVLAAAGLSVLASLTPALAALHTVQDCGDTGAAGQLRTIMNDAATQNGDTILVPACTVTLALGSAGEDANTGGDLDVLKNLRIQGAGPGLTVIDGGQLDRVFEIRPGVTALLSGMTIRNGRLVGGSAGVLNRGTLTLLDVVVTDNTALPSGGSIPLGGGVGSNGPLTVLNSTLTNNETGDGGGIGFGTAGPLVLENVTISGNRAFHNGGGIALPASPSMVAVLTNVTITGNAADSDNAINVATAGNGGGLQAGVGASVTIRNTILAGNTVGSGGGSGPDCFGTLTPQGANLIQSLTSCTAPGVLTGQSPNLGPLGPNGGPTPTHALLAGSPAIDAGDDATCAAADQRGTRRPADGDGDGAPRCDLGAYEAGVSAAPVAFPDFDGDGRGDLVVAQGAGGSGEVRVLSGASQTQLLSLFPFGAGFRGPLAVAACDLTGDGVPDLVVGAGAPAPPEVRVFDGASGVQFPAPLGSLVAYEPATLGSRAGFRGPVSVGCADVDGDGIPDIVTGPPAGGTVGPLLRVFSGKHGGLILETAAFDPLFPGGVAVGP